MVLFEAILLGIVQGFTEFLPVSSSAHLILIPWMFGWQGTLVDSLNFDVALHAGTLVAILAYFWLDWLDLFRKFFTGLGDGTWKTGEGKFVWFIVLATIPAGILGLKFEHIVEQYFRNPKLIVISLVVISVLMWAVDRFSAKTANMERMTLGHALFIGCAQALALMPGVSRSGITISAGMALKLKREAAAKFSFMLSAPIIAGAGLKSLWDLFHQFKAGTLASSELMLFPIGVLFAAVTGFFCIQYLLRYLQKNSTRVFVYYRWGLAILIVVVALLRG